MAGIKEKLEQLMVNTDSGVNGKTDVTKPGASHDVGLT